jgi:hypothetical protein
MSEEYVIINKTAIQQRIETLEKGKDKHSLLAQDEIETLKRILSQSSPAPELEKIWNAARETVMVGTPPFEATPLKYNTLEDYISKRKQ